MVKPKKLRMKKNQKNHRHSAEVTVIILLVAFLNLPAFLGKHGIDLMLMNSEQVSE